MKAALFLMNKKGCVVLESLVREGIGKHIALVVSSRDRAVQADYFDAIRMTCSNSHIPFLSRDQYDGAISDYTFVIGWRWMLPVTRNLIILHDSLLPKYRGFAPLVSALINGDREIGVTALYAAEEYDCGDIIMQRSFNLSYPVHVASAIDQLSLLYGSIVLDIMQKIVNGESLPRQKQDETRATYSLWRNDQDYRITWSWEAQKIQRFVNAVGFPYLGASTTLQGKLIRIIEAEAISDVPIVNRTPGKVIFLRDGLPIIVCGKGLLKIVEAVNDETRESVLPLSNFRVCLE